MRAVAPRPGYALMLLICRAKRTFFALLVFCHFAVFWPHPCLNEQDGKTLENEIEVVEGMKFDRGYISPYFVTDSKTQMCEMENPVILIVEKKASTRSWSKWCTRSKRHPSALLPVYLEASRLPPLLALTLARPSSIRPLCNDNSTVTLI